MAPQDVSVLMNAMLIETHEMMKQKNIPTEDFFSLFRRLCVCVKAIADEAGEETSE